MKVRIVKQPTGYINGREWPAVDETIDLPDAVAADMAGAGWVEPVAQTAAKKAEKRPAKKAAETR